MTTRRVRVWFTDLDATPPVIDWPENAGRTMVVNGQPNGDGTVHYQGIDPETGQTFSFNDRTKDPERYGNWHRTILDRPLVASAVPEWFPGETETTDQDPVPA